MHKTGLILEGGGMKCAYQAGVLDRFLENGIRFDYVIGVSAGAANGASFMAGQIGRNRRFYTDHVTEPDYFGMKSFIKKGDMFNLSYIYADLSNEDGADYLDYDAVRNNPAEYEVVATNALTGEPAYFGKDKMIRNNYVHIMASSAIPVVCRPVFIDGVPYYDGGISDAIPVKRALDQGCDRIVCVLSKSRYYVKKPEKFRPVYRLMCHKYPEAVKDMDRRHLMYQKCQKRMFKLEEAGRAFVFSLETDLQPGTYKMDPVVNQKLYELGLADFDAKKESLSDFMTE